MIELRKMDGEPIIAFSIYDAFGAMLVNDLDSVDFVLVGDSLSMVFKGYDNVRMVTLDEMLYHYRIVRRLVKKIPVILDLPYNSYEDIDSLGHTLNRLLEAGVDGVMIEGIYTKAMDRFRDVGIDFMVHLGYLPKYDDRPNVIGRDKRDELLNNAKIAEEKGAFAIKLELVSSDVAKYIRDNVDIPVLGVGSGPYVDGHILVLYDFIGLTPWFRAKFVRRYAELYDEALDALKRLIDDIKKGRYPDKSESY